MYGGYSNYKFNGSKMLGAPEESYLYSDSAYMGPQSGANALGSAEMASSMAEGGAESAASGAALGGPAGAAISVGGNFLLQHMAQRAADERARKQRAMEIEQKYGQDQNQGFEAMYRAAQGALR